MQRFAILTALGVFMFVAVGLSTITFAAPTLGNEFPILPKASHSLGIWNFNPDLSHEATAGMILTESASFRSLNS